MGGADVMTNMEKVFQILFIQKSIFYLIIIWFPLLL